MICQLVKILFLTLAPAAPNLVDIEIVYDPPEPSAETRQLLKLRRLTQSTLDAVLHEIVGQGGITGERHSVPSERGKMSNERLVNRRRYLPTSFVMSPAINPALLAHLSMPGYRVHRVPMMG